VSDVQGIGRCRDITDDHIAAAIESRDGTRALLQHAATIAKPREAGARVLLVFAKMATPECDWLEGALRVELARDGAQTVIESYAEIGAGLKERVFPRLVFNVSFDEFIAAIKKFPQAVAPLSADTPSKDRLILTATEAQKIMPPEETTSPRIPTPSALSVADLPTVSAAKTAVGTPAIPLPIVDAKNPPPKPLAKLKLNRRAPALGHTISEEIVRKPAGDSRRDATGEHPALQILEPPKSETKKSEGEPPKGEDVDKGWE